MRDIRIAIGHSRKATTWANTTISLEEFAERLRTPLVSAETQAEYFALPKSQQDELKDVGGFVGGTLKGGKRKAGCVEGRDLITLDLDNIPGAEFNTVIDAVKSLGVYTLIYSTRKHTELNPRLRVIIPLAETIDADKYEPVARMIAKSIGLKYCDPTTFEANRLMYWPSSSCDAFYYFNQIPGDLLESDQVLFEYGLGDAWKDVSKWPQVPGAESKIMREIKRQADPIAKEGIVGAFCRSYSITDALRLLDGAYIPTDDPNRWTYSGGSTVGGAVIYDDRFLYDHHASSPCCNQLVNAFDLIRVHLYAEEDADAIPGTPTAKLPSWQKMVDYANRDAKVSERLTTERAEAIKAELMAAGDNKPEELDLNWAKELTYNDKGKLEKTIGNCRLVIANDPNLKAIAFDEFTSQLCVIGPIAWDRSPERRAWDNSDDSNLRAYLEAAPYGLKGKDIVEDALVIVANGRKVNSVKDWLKTLVWDGVERVDTLLIDYLGAEDNPYTRASIRKALVAAVARAYMGRKPVKFDNMIILVGKQGEGKSKFLSMLGGQWFNDSLTSFEGKEAAEVIRGSWIVEVAELTAFSRSDVNMIKQFITKQSDKYRAAYARRAEDRPRRCVLFGTSNTEEFLRDATGNRRFWPIDINKARATKDVFADLPKVIEQVWAEAVVLYTMGEELFLTGDAEKLAVTAQSLHMEVDTEEGLILNYLNMDVPVNWDEMDAYTRRLYYKYRTIDGKEYDGETKKVDKVCAHAIYKEVLDGRDGIQHTNVSRIINDILRKHLSDNKDWTPYRGVYKPYGVQRGYERRTGREEDVG